MNRKSFVNVISLNATLLNNFDFDQYKVTQYNSLNVRLSNSQLNKLTVLRMGIFGASHGWGEGERDPLP